MLRAFFLFVSVSGLVLAQNTDEEKRILAKIDAALEIKQGYLVADIGTGDEAFFPIHLSRSVGPSGTVTCVDIDEQAMKKLKENLRKESVQNVDFIIGKPNDPKLPTDHFDLILISSAYHEMTEYRDMLSHIIQALKPGGRLVVKESILPSRRKEPREVQVGKHEISSDLVQQELRQAGFEIVNVIEPLYMDKETVRWLLVANRPAAVHNK